MSAPEHPSPASRDVVRVITTNDFIGSFFAQPTSFGALPGAAALAATVGRARSEATASVWVDTGDLTQGAPLNPLTDGAWGFLALREFDIDVSVIGNHELDWGLTHLRRWSAEAPFPRLCANAELGFPPTHTVDAAGVKLGIVGLTHPQLHTLHPEHRVSRPPTDTAIDLARELRADGAERIVLALHDGVGHDIARPDQPSDDLIDLCRSLAGHVDLILGGHTLRRHVGTIAGVPFLQPWPFGSEIGIADLHPDGKITLDTRAVGGDDDAPSWLGAATYAVLTGEAVAELDEPLSAAPGGDIRLVERLATGLLRAGDEFDFVFVGPWDVWNQPPIDGTFSYLPAGTVTEAQLLRLLPQCGARSAWGGQLLAADISREHAETAATTLAHELGYSGRPDRQVAVAARDRPSASVRVAVPPFYCGHLERTAGHPLRWTAIETTWRDGLRAALTAVADR